MPKHTHHWTITSSEAVSETDYHLVELNCECGAHIYVTQNIIAFRTPDREAYLDMSKKGEFVYA